MERSYESTIYNEEVDISPSIDKLENTPIRRGALTEICQYDAKKQKVVTSFGDGNNDGMNENIFNNFLRL